MKKILIVLSVIICLILVSSCGDETETPASSSSSVPASSATQSSEKDTEKVDPVAVIEVTGKKYAVDLSTVNIAYEESDKPTQVEIDYFKAQINTWFANSTIEFTNETSFVLSGTESERNDVVATGCARKDNELFLTIAGKGNVDVVIYEGKVSYLCDFYFKGWGMYFSIDYKLVTSE